MSRRLVHKDTTLHFDVVKCITHQPELPMNSADRIPVYAVMWFAGILQDRYGSYFAACGGRFVYLYRVTQQGERYEIYPSALTIRCLPHTLLSLSLSHSPTCNTTQHYVQQYQSSFDQCIPRSRGK